MASIKEVTSPTNDSSNQTIASTNEENSKKRGLDTSAEKRVPLACHRCRTKRARCSGDRPVCAACQKADEECIWPTGRKRKRTRREMEEQERKEREFALSLYSAMGSASTSNGPSQTAFTPALFSHNVLEQSSLFWNPISVSQVCPLPTPWLVPNTVSPGTSSWYSSDSHSGDGVPLGNSEFDQTTGSVLGNSEAPPTHRSGNSPLFRAIESQVAFISGDPSQHENLELFYYRFAGSTAIRPGINRISLKLQPRSNGSQINASSPLPLNEPSPSASEFPDITFDEAGLPPSSIYIPLLDVFFKTLSAHFPSISRRRMEERLNTGTMSAFLLNCICAIAARFHPTYKDCPIKACAPFVTKAQELIIPLLHLPTTDCATGLLLLSWANFGQNSDSGLWQYSGMAIRMALDLGIHEISEIYESSAHVIRTRLLFWSLFITDRILAFSTGRPPTIPEEIIDIPLPSDEDFTPDPALASESQDTPETVQPSPFSYLVRLMVHCGRIASLLNGRRGRPRTLVGPSEPNVELLNSLQVQLVQFYSELPDSLKWSANTFKYQEQRGQGGSFLTLHLWANSVLTLVYHPQLISHPSGTETPLSSNVDRSLKLALASARIITECLVFADLFASRSYLASPMAAQPILVACFAFIEETKANELDGVQEKPQTVDILLTSLARQNLGVLAKALQRMEYYWAGVNHVLTNLEERAAGLAVLPMSPLTTTKTSISLPDTGILRRFTANDPNTAPPTETSLMESIAKEATSGNTCSLDELFNSYQIEGFFVQPAEFFNAEDAGRTTTPRPDTSSPT